MDLSALRSLLDQVKSGALSTEEATTRLAASPVAELDYATLDLHRSLRQGFPEVIYGEGKTADQIVGIFRRLESHGTPVLATRLSDEKAQALVAAFPSGEYREAARAFALRRPMPPIGPIAVVTAGTSDLGVAEEAAFTAEVLGAEVLRVVDVGVAGVHRLLRRREEIAKTKVAVVVAGMEGALPTAVGGMVGIPVVAVPTSVGYGANLGGLAALLGMLNSCSPNVAVVNIDNGFGAGFYAALIARGAK
jgi:NCAIR mutase (PurE)-related protein